MAPISSRSGKASRRRMGLSWWLRLCRSEQRWRLKYHSYFQLKWTW